MYFWGGQAQKVVFSQEVVERTPVGALDSKGCYLKLMGFVHEWRSLGMIVYFIDSWRGGIDGSLENL